MSPRPVMFNVFLFIILWPVLIVVFRFVAKVATWRAIVYGTAISISLFLIAVLIANWYASRP
jgi:uncharacterized BrkB/YihY/UPF0761 family membrane protein